MQWRKFARLKTATGHSRTRRMLCCGRRKENGRSVPDLTASPGRAPPGPMPANQQGALMSQRQGGGGGGGGGNGNGGIKEPVLLQGDFRKVSGISSEIFRQIEAVENDHDPSTAAALEAVERRGEMIVRILEPRFIGGRQAVEAAQKLMGKGDARHTVQLVEIVKRPGQTLGLYIREGNGADRSDGVFISRIALESAVYNSGCLRVGDEILAVNLVDVTRMSLDDVVIIMSIPRRLVLAIRQRRGGRGANSPGPPPLSRNEHKPPPVVVIKRDLREEDLDDHERSHRSRSSRERRTGDGREMTESRSRLGLGLNTYSPQSEQLDLYYNSRPNTINEPPSWGYKPPPPPSVITEQPKGNHFTPSHSYYQNAGTLESLAEKVHSFYPGPSRRMSTGTGTMGMSQSHTRFPRSGSDQHLPRVEYSDFSSLGRHSLLRSSLKTGAPSSGGTLGRYGRYEPQSRTPKYGTTAGASTLTRRSRPSLDYSSDTEATIGPRPGYYYYNRPALSSIGARGSTTALGGGPDLAKFNSLPRDRPGASRLSSGLRVRLGDRLVDDGDGNLSAPELPARRDRVADLRSRISASPSIFTSDEYRAWLRRAPSSSAICEQMRASRDILNQQRAHRFSCSAENIHDVLKNTESIYSSRTGVLTGTLDRHMGAVRGGGMASVPVRSLSSQHLGATSTMRSPSVRRMRQLLELNTVPGSPGSGMSGHQSPAPTPSATLPRAHRQIDINPAEFAKYKLDKPVLDIGGMSGMLWIHLLAGRGLRAMPDGSGQPGGQQTVPQTSVRDLYCVLECDRVHKARTVVRSGDLQFDWDESFELDLVCNKQLDVLVYSWDPQHRHKLCYRGAVSLAALLRQSPLHQLALKVEPRGTIYLRIRHTDPVSLYRRRGLPSLRAGYPQLFGADLEMVVNREAKGAPGSAPVPIVLRRCVEEVERRGLDIIGLYRLCGSATKKRLLREAFERNSRAVELSPDHVPDINVITGVLKDYLRELPEPLFTRCLFQMTVDALAVCLPDDPEGNAKLMLSILDCLPRANRATLVFLLDHLSLVVSASERNKMSAQALATVMGPPLMLHSSNAAPGEEFDHAQPIAVLKYLLQIWPQPQTSSVSGRRGEPVGQRGSRVNALQAAKPSTANLHMSPSVVNNQLTDLHRLSAIPNTHQSPLAVGQSAQSPRVSQLVGHQPHQSAGSAGLGVRDLSQLPATLSPGSSSASTVSASASGGDTMKRGSSTASGLAGAISNKLRESSSNYSIKQEHKTNVNDHGDSEFMMDERKLKSNGTNYGPNTSSDLLTSRNVLFSSDLSASSYSIKDQLSKSLSPNTNTSNISINSTAAAAAAAAAASSSSINNSVLSASATSSSNLNAYLSNLTSPLAQHRNIQSQSASDTSYLLKNQPSNGSLSLGTYQFPSSNISSIKQQQQQHPSLSSSTINKNQQLSNNMTPSIQPPSHPSQNTITNTTTATNTNTSATTTSISSILGAPSIINASYNSNGTSAASTNCLTKTGGLLITTQNGATLSSSVNNQTVLTSASNTINTTLTQQSPSRSSLNNTNASSVARNKLYQSSDTNNYSINKNQMQQQQQQQQHNKQQQQISQHQQQQPQQQQQQQQQINLASSANLVNSNTSMTSTAHNQHIGGQSSMNFYGTLPKSAGIPYGGFNQTPPSASTTNSLDLYGQPHTTASAYRVQYSTTNPFLPTYNPPPGELSVSPIPSINLTGTSIDEE